MLIMSSWRLGNSPLPASVSLALIFLFLVSRRRVNRSLQVTSAPRSLLQGEQPCHLLTWVSESKSLALTLLDISIFIIHERLIWCYIHLTYEASLSGVNNSFTFMYSEPLHPSTSAISWAADCLHTPNFFTSEPMVFCSGTMCTLQLSLGDWFFFSPLQSIFTLRGYYFVPLRFASAKPESCMTLLLLPYNIPIYYQ